MTEWDPQPPEGTWGLDGAPVTSPQILYADRIFQLPLSLKSLLLLRWGSDGSQSFTPARPAPLHRTKSFTSKS